MISIQLLAHPPMRALLLLARTGVKYRSPHTQKTRAKMATEKARMISASSFRCKQKTTATTDPNQPPLRSGEVNYCGTRISPGNRDLWCHSIRDTKEISLECNRAIESPHRSANSVEDGRMVWKNAPPSRPTQQATVGWG